MTRRALLATALVAALAAPTASARRDAGEAHVLPGPDAGEAHALASVTLARCSLAHHSALFIARVRQVVGARRMAIRFTLIEREGDGGWAPVRAPGLGRWRRSAPDVRAFVFRQRVRGLRSGGAYRMLVRFRWYGAEGDVVRRARRRSGVCVQPAPLPNLRITRLRLTESLDWGQAATYGVRVANLGDAEAEHSDVTLFVDGAAVDTLEAGALAPGEVAALGFTGPACERDDAPVVAVADPNALVAESRERDNRIATTCAAIRW